jgi:two-component system C4-dicarboxylate transport response regulator DctD
VNILLVDDEEIVIRSLGRFLTRCGHRLKTASDGAEALLKIEEEVPDVVISDVRMPGLDGMGLMERLRARFPGLPVVLITGHGGGKDGASALREGAYGYLRKPIRLEGLVAVLGRIEEERR